MATQRFFHRFISLSFGVILALGGLPPATALGSSTPASPLPQDRGPVAPANSGLYRTTVVVSSPSRWQRLEALDVVILERQEDTGVVLADDEQLESLARLRFEPRASDELAALLAGQGPERAWLQASLQPLVTQGAAFQALLDDKAAAGEAVQSARASLRSAIHSTTPEQRAGMASSSSLDDDADGLTNTQEAWWCTDPLNPDSDGDGVSDGDEVAALLDWMANRLPGPPTSGKPFGGWPPLTTSAGYPGRTFVCQDDLRDSVPDMAERWLLGLNMNQESTDLDKFDDGQELFGFTNCPGGDLNCNYGDLPRSQDSGYVGAAMPGWVKSPGKHPLVAAYPVPNIEVLDSSLHVETVSVVTTDHTIQQGTENSYSTARLDGSSVSNTDTDTWDSWQEVSITEPIARLPHTEPDWITPVRVPQELGTLALIGAVAAGASAMFAIAPAMESTMNVNDRVCRQDHWWHRPQCKIHSYVFGEPFDTGQTVQNINNIYVDSVNGAFSTCVNQSCESNATNLHPTRPDEHPKTQRPGVEAQNKALSQYGNSMDVDEYSRLLTQTVYDIVAPLVSPKPTQTQTEGMSKGGSHSTSHSTYEEHTVTNVEAFSNSESWSTATAVNSAHTADLWFSYRVRNAGTEYAREIKGLIFNIYIGDDANPVCTYHVGAGACGVPSDIILLSNFMPGEEHVFTSYRIPLTLEQLKAVDLGSPIRIIVEYFDFGTDRLFYQNALGAGVLIAIEDGAEDGDELIDTYLIPTWGVETVLDLLPRYFPHVTDANGTLIAIWTPELRSDTPGWCKEPQVVGTGAQRTLWCKHALSTADWWNVYTNGLGDGSEGFQNTLAAPGATALFRFNADTDLDGYNDRSERRLGTDPDDAMSYPRPEILAGLHSVRENSHVTATLSLLNTGLYDAYGMQATMIAPNDSITITNNTVGGSGRVRAQQSVVVGSRINLESPLPGAWLAEGHAKPAHGGYYSGSHDRLYTFTVQACGNPGGCQVGSGTWRLDWNDGVGASGTLNFGQNYASPLMLEVGEYGVKLALLSGKVLDGEQFTIDARTPRDTFQFEVLEEPYTPPLVLVSYNDPQGNHRFIVPPEAMQLISPTADLMAFSGQMLPDVGVEIVTSGAAAPGANTTTLQVINPTETTLTDAHLFLDFINISGTVTSEVAITTTLPPGPSVVPATWDTAQFDPPYDPEQDYIVMAFWTDYQGNIIDTAARPLSSFQEDPRAFGHLSETAWDFGVAAPGQVIHGEVSLANTSFFDLHVQASAQGDGLSVEAAGLGKVPATGFAEYQITLDTTGLPPGPYSGVVSIRTNDVSEPVKQVQVTGSIADVDVAAHPVDEYRPWNEGVSVRGALAANEIITYTTTIADDQAEPLYLLDQEQEMVGRGRKLPLLSLPGTTLDENTSDERAPLGYEVQINALGGGFESTYPGHWVRIYTQNSVYCSFSGNTNVIYTRTRTPPYTNDVDWARWRPNLGYGGYYHVYVGLPNYSHSTSITTRARYWVNHADGSTLQIVNQNNNLCGWTHIGQYRFNAGTGGNVHMGDYTGDNPYRLISADAVKFVLLPPSTPGLNGIANSDGDGNFTVSWSAVFGTTEYVLQEDDHSAFSSPNQYYPGTGTSVNISGKPAGTWYYRVIANNPAGSSGWSGVQSTTVQPSNAPTLQPIANVDGDGNFTVIWSSVAGATGYLLQDDDNPAFSSPATSYSGPATQFNVSGKPNGTWYYRVRASNAGGSTNWSGTQSVVVNQPPNPPLNLDPPNGAGHLGRSVVLSWSDGGDPDNYPNPSRQFRAQMTAVGGPWSTTSNLASQPTATILVPDDGAYSWRAQAHDGASNSAWSPSNTIDIYSVDKPAVDQARLALPQSIPAASYESFELRYGEHAAIASPNGHQIVDLPAPQRIYQAATLDVIVAAAGGAATALNVDVGNDGQTDWTETLSWTSPVLLHSPDLAAALNAYLATQPAPGGTLVDVPIKVSLSTTGDLYLLNPALTPGADADPSIGPADISFSNNTPTETDLVTISATAHNGGIYQARNVMASFYAGDPASGGYLIGSDFLPAIPAGSSELASLVWDTTGYTGPLQVHVRLDPTDQLAELDENNNTAQSSITVLTRPDLSAAAISPSNPEPVVDEAVTVDLTLANGGQTDAGTFVAALYDGNPASGGVLICQQTAAVAGGGQTVVSCPWAPASTGLHRLFVVVDQEGVIGEFDEGNNEAWHDVYVGFAGPLLLDSGNAAADPPYTAEAGYGVVDQGLPDVLVSCGAGTAPEETLRRDPDGEVLYRFDHLLPGHYYHLDIILRECDGVGRQESILVDGNLIEGPVSLAGNQSIYRSLLLDPALYANRSITVAIEEPAANGAVVSQVNLYDIDYRYADAGGARDPQYPGADGYGWLDGVPSAVWGTLPYQSARVDQGDNQQRYRFDGLDPAKQYQVNMTFYQSSGTGRQQTVEIDGLPSGLSVNTGDYTVHRLAATIPLAAYVGDGSIVVTTRRTNASTGAMVNEISLEELTQLTGPRPAIANLRVSNVSDTSFTVSWTSNVPTTGYVHYGASDALGQLAYDERGSTIIDDTHHVKLENLPPGATIFFDALSGQVIDDNGGAHYSVTTGITLPPPGSDTVYGRVFKPDGVTLAGGALVYARVCDANGQGSPGCSDWLSALVDPANGFWYANLGQARNGGRNAYFSYSPAGDRLELAVEGAADCRATLSVDTASDSPVADIVLRCTVQASMASSPGWNLIALPLQPVTPHVAQSLLDLINSQGGQCSEIDRWRFGGWDAHINGLPFNDFAVELGKGYFTKCSASATWILEGNALAAGVPLALQAGWNLVSVPHPSSGYTAQSLLDAIAAQGGACSEIDRWLNGGWDAHINGLPFNDFAVEPHQGYFVKCSQPSSFIPSAAPDASVRVAWPEPAAPPALEPADLVAITDVMVTNRRDVALAITWRTDQPSTGWIEYGATPELGVAAPDDRGEKASSAVHHVTLTGLAPDAPIYYRVHSGGALADEGGKPFQVATTSRVAPSAPATAYGQINTAEGAPVVGSLVTGWLVDKAGSRSEPLSALVDGWGYWVLSLPEIDCQQFELHLEIVDPNGAHTEFDRPACQ